jgi:peptidoglycan/xylan/chitin deacetylase (PgdA/CDA1 family)
MIYLTGDVHTKTSNDWEQKIVGDDIDNAIKYLEILKKYKISCTLFINGESLDKDSEKVKELLKYDTELGGHTYDNFGGMNIIKSYLNRKSFGCVYGSEAFQKRDIEKTKQAFNKLGLNLTSWRTHAFGSNEKTFKILEDEGVEYVSDLVGDIKPFKEGITHLPINIPVDQNTIAYGELIPKNRDPFASCVKGRITAEEWFEILKKRVIDNEKKGIPSILLLHPTTMAVIDNFKLFEKTAEFLSKYKSSKVSEAKINF